MQVETVIFCNGHKMAAKKSVGLQEKAACLKWIHITSHAWWISVNDLMAIVPVLVSSQLFVHVVSQVNPLFSGCLKLTLPPPCVKCTQRYGADGLKLVNHEETVSFGQAVLKLTFDPGSPDDGMLTAECRLDHPFFVKNKGAKQGKKRCFSSLYEQLSAAFNPRGLYCFQVGLHSIQALRWCTMGSHATRCSWGTFACPRPTLMPLTVTTLLSLTHSEGKTSWCRFHLKYISHQ